ncbi:MAG: hypothetical protein GXY83_29085 [Rhodopirellula sp.]|nr:hypothetical protein [Rhodopirellula sp.]
MSSRQTYPRKRALVVGVLAVAALAVAAWLAVWWLRGSDASAEEAPAVASSFLDEIRGDRIDCLRQRIVRRCRRRREICSRLGCSAPSNF